MLSKDERLILQDTVEVLNRLYDRHSSVADALAFLATPAAMFRGSELHAAFDDAILRLREVAAMEASLDQKRDLGCNATDELLKRVAEQLRRDAAANPKRRHKLGRGTAGREVRPGR